MHHDELVRMINQIAEFFDAYPPDEAAAGVQQHVRKFWDPSMRADILAARADLADRLHPVARAALERLAAA
jgi:formate dehydrogenase subunit delta